jgi:hypothetical protein
MGEIKSTLDLVMEKTRHLKLNEAEKTAQRQKDAAVSLKGLILKYVDRSLTLAQLKRELDGWRQSFQQSDAAVVQETVHQIDLDGNEQPLLEMLEAVFSMDIGPLQTVLDAYRAAVRQALELQTNRLTARLADRYAISGTAVIANVENDAGWLATHRQLRDDYRQQLIDCVTRSM